MHIQYIYKRISRILQRFMSSQFKTPWWWNQ